MLAITQNRYFELKSKVKSAFYEAAIALKEIHDRKLYRVEFNTFEDFCQTFVGIGSRQGYNLIKSADVVENVNGSSQYLPSNEYQVRPLGRLEPKGQEEVWSHISDSYPQEEVTHAIVKSHVEAYQKNGNSVTVIDTVPDRAPVLTPIPCGPDERLTPEDIYQFAFFVLQGVTLDPCADQRKSQPVSEHFTKEDDGLSQEWFGKAFVHPPESLVEDFVAKSVNELNEGTIEAAILYLPAEPWHEWNELIKDYPRIFVRGADPVYKSGRMLVLLEPKNRFYSKFESLSPEVGWIYGYFGE